MVWFWVFLCVFLQWVTPVDAFVLGKKKNKRKEEKKKRHELAEKNQEHSFLTLDLHKHQKHYSWSLEKSSCHHKFNNKCSASVQPVGNSYEGDLVSEKMEYRGMNL